MSMNVAATWSISPAFKIDTKLSFPVIKCSCSLSEQKSCTEISSGNKQGNQKKIIKACFPSIIYKDRSDGSKMMHPKLSTQERIVFLCSF